MRSIRNYSSDLIQAQSDALNICRQVETLIEDANEIQRNQELLLLGTQELTSTSGGRSYSMSFNEDVDEATKAQLHKVANSKFFLNEIITYEYFQD